MERNQRYLFAGIAIVLVFLVAGGGVFAYNKMNEDDNGTQQNCSYNGAEYIEGEKFSGSSDDSCMQYQCQSGAAVCITTKSDTNGNDTEDSTTDNGNDNTQESNYKLTQTTLDGSEGYDVFDVSISLTSGTTATLSDDGSKLSVTSADLNMTVYTQPESNGYNYDVAVPSNTMITASGMNKELYRVQDQTLGYYYTDDFIVSGTTKCDGWTSTNPIAACASPGISFTNTNAGTENLYVSCKQGTSLCDSLVEQMKVTVLN
ncbi:hypothetical protein KC660_01230 [Candidatus Dojkabacteria bacterium]|uniref:Uncharacterized protein n=1 Tax=Candidatus Dojkabacteria bacterium TaxID=2099670 RepID=A0A955L356_9BACT|nr:hypothetical protein [Candidatus Dojkabacteria bacterium]